MVVFSKKMRGFEAKMIMVFKNLFSVYDRKTDMPKEVTSLRFLFGRRIIEEKI